MAAPSSILAWRIPWTEELGGLPSTCNNSPAESTSPENGWRWSVGPIPGRRLINETWWSANHGEWRWNDKDRANSVKVMAVKNKKRILKDFTSPNKYSRFSFNMLNLMCLKSSSCCCC